MTAPKILTPNLTRVAAHVHAIGTRGGEPLLAIGGALYVLTEISRPSTRILGLTTGATYESLGVEPPAAQPVERFMRKVDKTESCWLWMGAQCGNGYGKFFVTKTSERKVVLAYAHRWYFEYVNGPIEAGLQLDHLCKVRHCVNPEHLEPVTARENLIRGDGFVGQQSRRTHCPRGHEYTPENTTVRKGCRHCNACVKAKGKAYAARQKALRAEKRDSHG